MADDHDVETGVGRKKQLVGARPPPPARHGANKPCRPARPPSLCVRPCQCHRPPPAAPATSPAVQEAAGVRHGGQASEL
jgi:hypothetical protein